MQLPEPAIASQEFSVIHSSDGATAFSVGRVRWPRTGGSRAPSRMPSRPSGFYPSRDHESLSPEALAVGSRRHFIPALLSLPLGGRLLNRSRDCSRSPPAAFSVGAMRTLLRPPLSPACASAQFCHSTVRERIGSWIRYGAIAHRVHVLFWAGCGSCVFGKGI
jgi:hypothetical protein